MNRCLLLSALRAVLVMLPVEGFGEGTGTLGSVSSCPAAPSICSAAVSFLLSPQSGLTLMQASAAIHTSVLQSVQSAPNMAPQIARQTLGAISRAAFTGASQSLALPNGTSQADALATKAPLGITATEGYSAIIQSIVQGAIQGAASSGMNTSDLKNIISAISSSIVIDASNQAGASAAAAQNAPLPADKSLPMDNARNAVAIIKTVVETALETASSLGIPRAEIAASINLAGQEAMATAQTVTRDTISADVATLAAGQAASQAAVQVASQVAKEVAQEVVAQVYRNQLQNHPTSPGNQNPSALVPPTPGQNLNPRPFPNPPVPTPTPFPTPPPTPAPTPTPPSPR